LRKGASGSNPDGRGARTGPLQEGIRPESPRAGPREAREGHGGQRVPIEPSLGCGGRVRGGPEVPRGGPPAGTSSEAGRARTPRPRGGGKGAGVRQGNGVAAGTEGKAGAAGDGSPRQDSRVWAAGGGRREGRGHLGPRDGETPEACRGDRRARGQPRTAPRAKGRRSRARGAGTRGGPGGRP